ncbi:hypothetical protein [Rosenbergiella collisarenosi]|uniref:hypothetical protein n=1 Tax=Rosenbergiella collisarenosi TaxID=1544695 RepID=UPI001F4E2CDD|nr:hypothetical protein [Rosenbergiella collisarenosi]
MIGFHVIGIAVIIVGVFTLFDEFGFGAVMILAGIVLFFGNEIIDSLDDPTPQQIEDARALSKCKLIEENIPHGYFSSNTNRLNCNGVIKNIPTSDYNQSMELLAEDSAQ